MRLRELIAAMGISVRALLRKKGTPYKELGLDDPKWSDVELLDFMVAHSRVAGGLSTSAIGSGFGLFRAQPVGRFACCCAGRRKSGSRKNPSRRSSMRGRSRISRASI
jgi:hypothetical protein